MHEKESAMACTSNCPTQDHRSWGECVRSKGLKIAYANSAGGMDLSAQKRWDKDLDAYRAARAQGIQPSGTSREQVERAVAISNETGSAFTA
jgi:hypothetical protein